MLETEPPKIKGLGRKVKPWDEEKWRAKREDIFFRGLFAKFYQNPELRDQLVQTYPTQIVEASPDDEIWGIGLSSDDPRAQDPTQWLG